MKFRTRSIIILVAVLAIPLGLGLIVEQRVEQKAEQRKERCLRLWNYHNGQAEIWAHEAWKNALIICGDRSPRISAQELVERHTRLYGPDAGLALKRVIYHQDLCDVYASAYDHPWTSFLLDPLGP
jgi:hypothetical protein